MKIEELRVEGLEPHDVASLHRTMSDSEYEQLKEWIHREGQLDPIKVFRGRIVDGRHRTKALQELGIETVKAEVLPHNMSLTNLKGIVMASEARRTDTLAQRAIKAYRYMNSEDDVNQTEAGTLFNVHRSEISRVGTIEKKIGSDLVDEMYANGFIVIGASPKKIKTLKGVIKAYDYRPREDNSDNNEPLTEEEKTILSMLQFMEESGKLTGIARMKSYIDKALVRMVSEEA